MIKAIIFDCFGVLLADVLRTKAMSLKDTKPQVAEVIFDTLKQLDRGLISREEGMAHIAGALGIELQAALEMIHGGEVRNAALIDAIPALHAEYKIGLLSNVRGRVWLDDRFLPGELDKNFDVVIASGDVGMVKPEPGIYHLIAQRLGVLPEECVMIDDLQSGCDGAVAVGMKAVQYHNNDQALSELHALLADPASV